MNSISFVLVLVITSMYFSAGAQRLIFSNQVMLDWDIHSILNPENPSSGESVNVLGFNQANYINDQNGHPYYSLSIPFKSKITEIKTVVSETLWQECTSEELDAVNLKNLPNSLTIEDAVGNSRGRSVGLVSLIPLKIENGQVYKLISFKLDVYSVITKPDRTGRLKAFATNSVLNEGSFAKIGVLYDGVYKVDYAYLIDNGIIQGNISSDFINVYGNGYGILPEDNSIQRPDDLLKNAIKVEDGGDNVFNDGDYFLFYAKGPNRWEFETQSYIAKKHYYEDTSFYFIGIDSINVNPKRVSMSPAISSPATHTVTSFIDGKYINQDFYNLIKSGREWYGDHFDVTTDRSYNFSFPNISTVDPVQVKIGFMSKTLGNGASSSFKVEIPGTGVNRSVSINSVGVGSYTPAALPGSDLFTFTPVTGAITMDITYNKYSSTSEGWLDYILVNATRQLKFVSGQLLYRDTTNIGLGNIGEFQLQNASDVDEVWDVTVSNNARSVSYSMSGNSLVYKSNLDSIREFVAFDESDLSSPSFVKLIDNQNLHGLGYADLLIVVPDYLRTQAERLADHRRNKGLSVHVVDLEEIYNEFSSGMKDITAIRWFCKMFYERAAGNASMMPKYLLLFGDGSYDNMSSSSAGGSVIPTYQSPMSFYVTSSFTSDDYFAILDDNESFNYSDLSDIAVGRLPVKSVDQASLSVDKIIKYDSKGMASLSGPSCSQDASGSTHGNWRNKILFVADDEDGSQYIDHCQGFANYIEANYPSYIVDKVYLDAYKQESTPGGERYPEVYNALDQKVQKGVLVVNYVGHGGEVGWAHERILDLTTIQGWTNYNSLPLFITATCEFSRFDDPGRTSAGEFVFLNPRGGGIALFTTTRLTFSWPNQQLNQAFYENAFQRDANGNPMRFGDIYLNTKNQYAAISSDQNFRNFTLLGDPSQQIAVPFYNAVVDSVNDISVNSGAIDTLKALGRVKIDGHVEDLSNTLMSNYNGIAYVTVYDKYSTLTTLSQNSNSPTRTFSLRKNVLYNGKATIKDGYYSFEFIVPKDIAFNYGNGRVSVYFTDGNLDGIGYTNDVVVGGADTSALVDSDGPSVELFMNDEQFVSGGITDEEPDLFAKLFDENGINTVGNSIGHDLEAILDENTENTIVLNDFYESDIDTYKSGSVRYPFSELEEGEHTLSLKAWDVNNNSAKEEITFIVAKSEKLALSHVLNYPNPFTTRTEFYFEHNQVCTDLDVQIQVFTVSGKLVKSIVKKVRTEGFRIEPIEWNGRDDFGDPIGRGVYVYKVKVINGEESEEVFEKLVILQ